MPSFSSPYVSLFRPLSESKVLKKKFDAIFDASKYSKALENVKEIMRQQVLCMLTPTPIRDQVATYRIVGNFGKVF